MRLQYALDTFNRKDAFAVLSEVHDLIDIVEAGTPFILQYGVQAVKDIKDQYPSGLSILADMKICDGGTFEADLAYDAGADITTVMGFTQLETIKGVIESAKSHQKKVLVDMMCVQDLAERSKRFVDLGADYICVHNATDALDIEKVLHSASIIRDAVGSEHLVIAGGVNLENIDRVVSYLPQIIIVGTCITKSSDKRKTISELKSHFIN